MKTAMSAVSGMFGMFALLSLTGLVAPRLAAADGSEPADFAVESAVEAMAGSARALASPAVFKGYAVMVIKPEKVEAFKAEALKIIGPTRREPGNLFYEVFQIVDKDGRDTNRFEFYELFKDEKAMLVDHKENTAHMKAFFKAIAIGTDQSWVESFEVGGKMARRL